MDFEPKCRTTAMGIMPHKDPDRALALVFSLDIPFWPQLPRSSFSEDMFAQFSRGFPGAAVDLEGRRVIFDSARFVEEVAACAELMADPPAPAGGLDSSLTFSRFLAADFSDRPAIRGQVCGPVNFGFRVTDGEGKPIIYNDEVRAVLFEFALGKVNAQYRLLRGKHPNAFVWVDEPGLGWVFNSFAGYSELQAESDYREFLGRFEGPRALHLCLNVHLPYLLGLGLDILSIDAFQLESMPRAYAEPIAGFLKGGGIISWGIVPTESMTLDPETPESLYRRLLAYWEVIEENADISARFVAERALIAPSKCCIKNAVRMDPSKSAGAEDDPPVCAPAQEETLVERAFQYVREISGMLRERFGF